MPRDDAKEAKPHANQDYFYARPDWLERSPHVGRSPLQRISGIAVRNSRAENALMKLCPHGVRQPGLFMLVQTGSEGLLEYASQQIVRTTVRNSRAVSALTQSSRCVATVHGFTCCASSLARFTNPTSEPIVVLSVAWNHTEKNPDFSAMLKGRCAFPWW